MGRHGRPEVASGQRDRTRAGTGCRSAGLRFSMKPARPSDSPARNQHRPNPQDTRMNHLLIAAVLLLPTAPPEGNEPASDLVIRGGRVVDGTGNPWFLADVAIRGDRIAAVGRDLRGAKGHI